MKAASVNLFVSNTYSLTQSVFLVRVERYSACITVILEWIAVLIAFHRSFPPVTPFPCASCTELNSWTRP